MASVPPVFRVRCTVDTSVPLDALHSNSGLFENQTAFDSCLGPYTWTELPTKFQQSSNNQVPSQFQQSSIKVPTTKFHHSSNKVPSKFHKTTPSSRLRILKPPPPNANATTRENPLVMSQPVNNQQPVVRQPQQQMRRRLRRSTGTEAPVDNKAIVPPLSAGQDYAYDFNPAPMPSSSTPAPTQSSSPTIPTQSSSAAAPNGHENAYHNPGAFIDAPQQVNPQLAGHDTQTNAGSHATSTTAHQSEVDKVKAENGGKCAFGHYDYYPQNETWTGPSPAYTGSSPRNQALILSRALLSTRWGGQIAAS
ncbi:hypothetical protein B0H65DRAFT_536798 [Neurospora tetraspora]|uniref:Uncharacterized protein n=1 Tax=Neurospora tetraspora TaxID=94610 RepID=A0AAE0JJ89_9PEZI|nr:hypothetical protein B0H65DRAFT_536798 [Neurospora tetraspora]